MMHADRRLHHPVSWFRLLKWGLSFAWVGLPTLVVSALPGHHPSDFADPIWMSSWLTHFDPETGTIPEPSFLTPGGDHARLNGRPTPTTRPADASRPRHGAGATRRS